MANAQQGLNEQLTGGRELSYINQRDNYAGSLFSRIIDAVNTGFTNAGVSAVGKVSPPPKVDNITIQGTLASGILTCPGEIFHAVLTHNQSVNKGIRYFSEIDTNPNFTAPHVIDHGTSRSVFLNLPTFMNDNKTLQTYYHRSYAQYTGSNHVLHGIRWPRRCDWNSNVRYKWSNTFNFYWVRHSKYYWTTRRERFGYSAAETCATT